MFENWIIKLLYWIYKSKKLSKYCICRFDSTPGAILYINQFNTIRRGWKRKTKKKPFVSVYIVKSLKVFCSKFKKPPDAYEVDSRREKTTMILLRTDIRWVSPVFYFTFLIEINSGPPLHVWKRTFSIYRWNFKLLTSRTRGGTLSLRFHSFFFFKLFKSSRFLGKNHIKNVKNDPSVSSTDRVVQLSSHR